MGIKVRGGTAHDPRFFVREGQDGVTFSIRSKEPRQWKRIFREFKKRIPGDYRDVVQTEGEWVWEVWPLTGRIVDDLCDIFENFRSAHLCWSESPTLPGFEGVKGE